MHAHRHGCNKAVRTKTVRMVLKREELLYDIKNNAYVEGDVMQVKDEHDRHQVQDIGEEGNIDRVTRMLDLAHAECVEALYPYTKEVVEAETELDDIPSFVLKESEEEETESTDYEIFLLVPDDYSKTTIKLLVKYIHEYMVCRVLADWLSITKPSSSANWQGKADEMMESMRESVNFRVGRVRRTLTPFG